MLRVSGLKLSLDEDIQRLPFLAAKRLQVKTADIREWHIYKESIDARKDRMIYLVYTVDVTLKDEKYIISRLNDPGITLTPPLDYVFVVTGTEKLKDPPIIVGTGPAGLFAGLLLARMGYRPLLLERGDDVDARSAAVRRFWEGGSLDPESNVQFGEGGAGSFSDGKLTTLIKDKRCRKVLADLVEAGGPPEIHYSYKPHIGTDILKGVVKNIRTRIIELGGCVRFRSRVTDLDIRNGKIKGVVVNGEEKIPCQAVVLAIGHSARDTFHLLDQKKLHMTAKPFSIGVRIEHPLELINKAQYKEFAGHPRLGAADYKLAFHSSSGRSAYTFCMCPGGVVVAAASEEGGVVTNGMSYHARDGANANSALLVGVTPEDFPGKDALAGIRFQRQWETLAYELGGRDYRAPVQLAVDFLAGQTSQGLGSANPTYPRGVTDGDLSRCLPDFVTATLREALLDFDRRIKGFVSGPAVMTGVETRSSSPVRIQRTDNCEANVTGIFPAGEGAGYAGGIISAAVDGMRAGEAVTLRFKPLAEMGKF